MRSHDRFTLSMLLLGSALLMGPGPSARAQVTDSRVGELVRQLEVKERRKAAREELLELGRGITPQLLSRPEGDPFTIRWEIANLLGLLRDERGVAHLVESALADPSPHVRWRSCWALKALPASAEREATSRLEEALSEADESRRWNAAVALSLFGVEAARPRLEEGLSSPSDWRRWEAVNALGRVHGEATPGLLGRTLREGTDRERREAVLSLGAIGGSQARDLLVDSLRDESAEIRWRACQSLAKVGWPETAAAELRYLAREDPDSRVREHALRALEK